jgi:hypothetical protein
MRIKGLVNGEPTQHSKISPRVGYKYATKTRTLFSIELLQDINTPGGINMKQGDSLVVGHSAELPTYIRKGDEVELEGLFSGVKLKDVEKAKTYFFNAEKVYNLTLKFSLDF